MTCPVLARSNAWPAWPWPALLQPRISLGQLHHVAVLVAKFCDHTPLHRPGTGISCPSTPLSKASNSTARPWPTGRWRSVPRTASPEPRKMQGRTRRPSRRSCAPAPLVDLEGADKPRAEEVLIEAARFRGDPGSGTHLSPFFPAWPPWPKPSAATSAPGTPINHPRGPFIYVPTSAPPTRSRLQFPILRNWCCSADCQIARNCAPHFARNRDPSWA